MNKQYTTCRYNKNHKVLKSRLLLHESKCPDSKGSKCRHFGLCHPDLLL